MNMINIMLDASWVFLFAALGELFSQRSGVLNIGVEGLMLAGALSAYATANITGNPWIGVVAGLIAGGILGLAHAVLSISLGVSQVISGTGIWIFSLGLTTYIGTGFTGASRVSIEANILGFTPLFFLGLALVPIFWFVISKTRFGLRVRAVGEDPSAAEATGINVTRTRYICVLIGGIMGGLSGSYLTLVHISLWSGGMTAGRGWIALALVIFAMWKPFLLLLGALFFGTLWITGFYLQSVIPNAPYLLLQMIPYVATIIVLVLMSFERFRRGVRAPAALGKAYFRD